MRQREVKYCVLAETLGAPPMTLRCFLEVPCSLGRQLLHMQGASCVKLLMCKQPGSAGKLMCLVATLKKGGWELVEKQ